MKFLLDVCAASRRLQTQLTDAGHDVVSAVEIDRLASDESLLALATEQDRVLVTKDKDFGELVFVRRLPHPCIIRLVDMDLLDEAATMADLIERYADDMAAGSLIVVTPNRVRIRRGLGNPNIPRRNS